MKTLKEISEEEQEEAFWDEAKGNIVFALYFILFPPVFVGSLFVTIYSFLTTVDSFLALIGRLMEVL